jgi:uncharacterized membrane protein
MDKQPSMNDSSLNTSKTRRESHIRTMLKTLSWRIIATLTTVIITYIVTGSLDSAWKVGSVEFIAKMFIYYVHERIWQLAPRGYVRKLFGS